MSIWLGVIVIYVHFVTYCMPERLGMKYPFVVDVRLGGFQHICCGSLLNFRSVLTSANMLVKFLENPKVLSVTRFNQTRNVESIYFHPEFNSKSHAHDLALVFLDHPFEASNMVDACRIPQFQMHVEMIVKCKEVELIGCENNQMISMNYRVLSNKECSNEISYNLEKSAFCAVELNSGDCSNFNGSPAVCDGFVFAVASFGCAPKVFTRVDMHLKFLFRSMGPKSSFRFSKEEEGNKKSRGYLIVGVTSSLILLTLVLLLFLCTVVSIDKLKCCNRSK